MPPRYWLFVALTLALTIFIGYGTFATARLLQRWTPDRNLLLLPAENVLRLFLVFVCILLGVLSGVGARQLGWQLDAAHWPDQVLAGVVWGVFVAGFFYLATRWLVARTGERFYSSVIVEAIVPRNGSAAVLVALAMIPVVLVEELLFRSLLLGGLIPIAPTWLLLIGLGVLFGVMHSPQGIWGMSGAALAGMLFGGLFLWYGTIVTPIVAHYITNLLQIGMAMRLRNRESSES
jgi:membrane protease YdiL (CAAX protease family)